MPHTRERALDAAVTLAGTEGVRALTHGRIDAAAGLPPGSTSNHFRTRAALIAGVVEWIREKDQADAGAVEIRSPEQLIGALTAMIAIQSGPLAVRTRARYALFLEADDEAAVPLREGRLALAGWLRAILRDLGGEAAAAQTSFVMATADGLLLHRVTVDPDAPFEAAIRHAVESALGPAGQRA